MRSSPKTLIPMSFVVATCLAQGLLKLNDAICPATTEQPFLVSNGTDNWAVCCSTSSRNETRYSALWLSATGDDGGRIRCCENAQRADCEDYPPSPGIDCDIIEPTGAYAPILYGGDRLCKRSELERASLPLFRPDVGALCAFGTSDKPFLLDGNHYCCESGTKVMAVMPRESGSGWNLKTPYPRCCSDEAAMNCSDPKHVLACPVGTQVQMDEWWSWCSPVEEKTELSGGSLVKAEVIRLLICISASIWALLSS